SGLELMGRQHQPTRVEVNGCTTNLQHQQSRCVGTHTIGQHTDGILYKRAARLLANSLERIERGANNTPNPEPASPTRPRQHAIASILLVCPQQMTEPDRSYSGNMTECLAPNVPTQPLGQQQKLGQGELRPCVMAPRVEALRNNFHGLARPRN